MIVHIIILILSLIFLAFIIIFPSIWASIVDKENNFWVKKGIFKESTAKRMAKYEKGNILKVIVVFGIAAASFNIWLIGL